MSTLPPPPSYNPNDPQRPGFTPPPQWGAPAGGTPGWEQPAGGAPGWEQPAGGAPGWEQPGAGGFPGAAGQGGPGGWGGQGLPGYGQFGGAQSAWDAQAGVSTYAGWGWRLLGLIIDGIITGIPAFLVGLVGGRALYYLVELAIGIAFAVMIGTSGSSPGMRAMGLRLVHKETGQPIGAGTAILRYILRIVDNLICFVGSLWPLWDKDRQTLLGDKLTKSVVIRNR